MCGARFCAGAEVSLAWDQSPSPGVFAYRVYYGTSSDNYEGFVQVPWTATKVSINNLKPESTYYFRAKAMAFREDEIGSDFSNEAVLITTNTPPTVNVPAGVFRQNPGPRALSLSGITSGRWDEPQVLTVTAKSNDPSMAPDPEVRYLSPSSIGALIITPNADAVGWLSFNVTVTDSGEKNNVTTKTFWILLNNPPTLDPVPDFVVSEDSGPQTIQLTGISPGSPNESNQEISIAAQSGNASAVSVPTITYKNPDTTGLLTFKPAPNGVGLSIMTVTVQDGQYGNYFGKREFRITVLPVNDPPTLNPLSDVIVPMNAVAQVALTGITSGAPNEAQSLTITATSSDPTLIAPVVSYISASKSGSLSFTPTRRGTGTVNVTVNDGGLSNNIITRSFKVAVGPPRIFAVRQISNDARTVTLAWSTDQPASCYLEYGRTSALGSRTAEDAATTTHTVTLSNLTPGTGYSARITATSPGGISTSATMAITENVSTIIWPAESGELLPPMAVYTNNLAQSSAYIGGGAQSSGTATYLFNAARGLNYRVWARVSVPAGGEYLYASVDGGAPSALFAPEDSVTNRWHWALLREGVTTNAAVLQMTAGTKSLTISSRSPDLLVDEFAITNDPQWQPILRTTKPRLTATRNQESTATIEWTDPSGNAEWVGIEYSVDGTNFQLLTARPAEPASCAISGLGGSVYYFRIFSYNSVDRTAYSNVAVVWNPF